MVGARARRREKRKRFGFPRLLVQARAKRFAHILGRNVRLDFGHLGVTIWTKRDTVLIACCCGKTW